MERRASPRRRTLRAFGAHSVVGATSYTNLSQNGQRVSAVTTYQMATDSDVNPETWVDPFYAYLNPTYNSNYVPPPF